MSENTEGILTALARLEGKVDVAITQHQVKIDELWRRDEDKEKRIRVLERDHISKKVAWAAAGLLVPLVAVVLAFALNRLFT